MKHPLLVTLATLVVVATTACSDAGSEPAAIEPEGLVASASSWTPADLTRGLEVDDATRQEIDAGLRTLHASLLELDGRELTAEDARAIHQQHAALLDSLDPDVRETLTARLHERMHEHEDDRMASLHERMRRLHRGAHDADGSGH